MLKASGQQVFGMPINPVGNAVSQVYLSEAPTQARDNSRTSYRLFKHGALRLTLIASVLIGLTAWFAAWLFTVIFGQSWGEADVYVHILGATS